jgi:hypothetical protein
LTINLVKKVIMGKLGPYLKAVVAILGAALTSLATYYGGSHWYPIAVSVVTAISVYLVPNTPKPSAGN